MQLTRLGPYEIGKPLGKGGMGSVYEARNVETGERVAVKALTPHLALAEGFRERFEAEIESLKVLRHEGIVRLYGYGEQEGVLFYSMELVDGTSLEEELKAGRRFNWREVTSIAIQLSLALKHAHDHGIVHRDIKPANVLLYNDEKVKLADFGIARLFGMSQLTTAGGVLGTADYMSPEQADGRPVTAKCDQYSLGGVMYALLAGRPPFRASNLPQMLQLQRFAKPEPVRAFAPNTPEQLERVIAQLLSKDPAERFPNMQVLARHLQAMVNALSRPTADDFALVGDDASANRADTDWGHSISIEVTQAEPEVRRRAESPPAAPAKGAAAGAGGTPGAMPAVAPADAATLAADEVLRTQGGAAAATANLTEAVPALSSKPPVSATSPEKKVVERPARFTTVEEEEARRAAQHQRSWFVVAVQLAMLLLVLVGMVWVVYDVMQPRTANELYEEVATRAQRGDADAMLAVSSEIDEFLRRFPDDPRAGAMRGFQEQIVLDKLDRKVQRAMTKTADSLLTPIEQLYWRAISVSKDSPEVAAAKLQSLVDLYPPAAPGAGVNDEDARTAAVLARAKERLAELRTEIAQQTKRERAAVEERLRAAAECAVANPTAAAAMYRAIADLYAETDWAVDLVAVARARLRELEGKK
jgi:hypothetical protein